MSDSHTHTARGREPDPSRDRDGTPTSEKLSDGQYADHWVLSPEERSRGWVRPYRRSYVHVGIRPQHPTRELTDEEKARHNDGGPDDYVCYEPYPEGYRGSSLGRFWTQRDLDSGCGTETTMPSACAETYARQPGFYGSTFCCHCRDYFRVGELGEFVWDDGTRVGT